MYKLIEEMYKKKSPYNRIKKWTFWIYLVFIAVSLIFNFYNKIIAMIVVFVVMIIIMKKVCESILKIKLYINFERKNDNDTTLPNIIRNKEHEMFKNYSIKNDWYNEKTLLCIINHYRELIKPKVVNGNLLAVLSIVIPTMASFYTKDGFDSKGFIFLICIVVIMIFIYFSYRQIIEAKKFLKGEDGMNERLEEIFSELYAECINDVKYNNVLDSKKNVRKIANKKSKVKKK